MSNSLNGRKVAVIGCGFVGSTTAYSLMQSKLFTDMVLIDVDTNRAEGEALDISHGIPYYSPMNIYAGTYEDLSDASIVIITAGANQKPGETRLDLVQKNVAIFKTIVPRIMEQGFDGIFLGGFEPGRYPHTGSDGAFGPPPRARNGFGHRTR